MSYEGYTELLCDGGHYGAFNVYVERPKRCAICRKFWAYRHSVDETNGFIEDDPGTYPARKEAITYEDIWHRDHYGNRYATKRLLYRPLDNWHKITYPQPQEQWESSCL